MIKVTLHYKTQGASLLTLSVRRFCNTCSKKNENQLTPVEYGEYTSPYVNKERDCIHIATGGNSLQSMLLLR